ncbi:MAG TPA: inositol monophosphatase family protein [bacterium]|nr:inositol monophosphatase family protein [bacterium]
MNTHKQYTDDLELALSVAQEAGRLLHDYFGHTTMEMKGENEVVTEADRASEQLIAQRLTESRPHDALIAEEGTTLSGDGTRKWVVDPLDGTNNFAHGFWAYAVSIALLENDEIVVGAVHAPEMDQTFAAVKGQGATLNRQPLRVSATTSLADAVCATGFPYARRTLARNNLAEFQRVLMAVQGMRRVGSAALDLCWTAAGRFDGYWEMHLKPWDVAAGILICREAGGRVTNLEGGAVDLEHPHIAATNGLIHEELLALLH